ncbi:MAG TPA: hypothetical protein VNB90_10905 [Cytophagaceae bacterium]|nr:hypothetical protein [Cytophagaceae bacterium]
MVPSILQAQIANIEKYRLDKDTSNAWLGNTGLGLASKKQQNTVNEFSAYLNVVYLSGKHSYMTINYTDLQQVNKFNFISEGYTHWRANFFRKQFVSYEPFFQLQYDKGRGLDSRNLYGLSFRFNLLHRNKDRKKLDITVSTGLMYEEEYWQGKVLRFGEANDSTRAHTQFIKSTSNFFLRAALHENITLYTSIYYQARFEKFTHPRIVSDIQCVFKITKKLSFSTTFGSTYDALPIVAGNVFTYKLSGNFMFQLNQ